MGGGKVGGRVRVRVSERVMEAWQHRAVLLQVTHITTSCSQVSFPYAVDLRVTDFGELVLRFLGMLAVSQTNVHGVSDLPKNTSTCQDHSLAIVR